MQGQTAAASRRQTKLHEYAHLPILFKYMSQIVDDMWVSQGLQKLCFHLELILLDQIPTCQYLHCHCEPSPSCLVYLQEDSAFLARLIRHSHFALFLSIEACFDLVINGMSTLHTNMITFQDVCGIKGGVSIPRQMILCQVPLSFQPLTQISGHPFPETCEGSEIAWRNPLTLDPSRDLHTD